MELHEAIRRAYEGRTTQAEIAAALDTTQSTVSRWAKGDARPSLEDLAALEETAGRPRGFVLRLAGFVADQSSALEAIAADPALDETQREMITQLYRALTKTAE